MIKKEMPKTDFLNNGYTIPYPDDPFEMNSGPFYLGKGNNGETIVALEVSQSQCNSGLVAHGGLIMTLADLAVCHEAVKNLGNLRALTVSLTANFLKPAKKGTILKAFPELSYRTKRTAFAEAYILADDEKVFTCTSVIRLIPCS
ncbi:MAG: PaaI family thioesterase [Pseudomonadota bacterium]|nr:PaaI family thioesterase [Pseudomonadota bacterium]